jgi:DNA-binding transcriptional regulator PaaX
MGEIETKIRADIRRTKINSAIIGSIALTGTLAVGLVALNVLGALGKLGILNPQKNQNIKRSLTRLIKHGYVTVEGSGLDRRTRLTSKGEKFAALMGEGKLAPKKPKRWDHKWRMLIFDIPERRRPTRAQLRITLMNLGFHRLQDSVWVYPYDCEDLVTLLKTDFRIGRDLLYVVADAIEGDTHLRRHFGLK